MTDTSEHNAPHEVKRDKFSFHSVANFLGWVSAWIFLTGGLTLKGALFSKPFLIELSQWGLFLGPLAYLVILNRPDWRDLSFVKFLYRIWPSVSSASFTKSLIIFAGLLTYIALLSRHFSFQSEWDLSIYANACANNLHSSFRDHRTLLADHFEPILYLFIPFCKSVNPALFLLAVQCATWTLGALGIQKISLRLGFDQSVSCLASCLYMLFSGNQTISYYDFHAYGLSLGTVPWLLYFILSSRIIGIALLTTLHLAVKENTSLFIGFLGLWIWTAGQRKLGATMAITGAIWFIVVMYWMFPNFRDGQTSHYFARYYGYLGNTLQECLMTIFLSPHKPIAELLKFEKLVYLFKVFAPFCFIHFLNPATLIPALPMLAVALLSNEGVMYSASFHYEAELYPWLFVSALLLAKDPKAAERLAFLQNKLGLRANPKVLALWLTVMIVFFTGSTPQGRISYYMPSRQQSELDAKLNYLSKKLRPCKVATVERLSSHLASLPHITMLDEQAKADAMVIAYPQGSRLSIQSFSTIEDKYVAEWSAAKVFYPIPYDRDFRVWLKPTCTVDLDL